MTSTLLAALAAVFTMTAQSTPAPAPTAEAAIPFANDGGIRDWQADGEDTLYIQDRSGAWYRATMFARCHNLRFSTALGFETRGMNIFDRFSSVVVDGRRCALSSLVKSGPPPVKPKRGKSGRPEGDG
jgi:hypothetical protein